MNSERILPFTIRGNRGKQPSFLSAEPVSLFSLGRDIKLLVEREWALRRTGYLVRSSTIETLLLRNIAVPDTISLFCHTLGSEECLFIAAHLRRYTPENRLILLTHGDSFRPESVLFHSVVREEDGLKALCRAIDQLTSAA